VKPVRLGRAGLGWAALGALAYVPLLCTAPGTVAADTKQYLYLDPGRLLSRAPWMWDPNIGMGTVTHQNIGYLFPMGPYYAAMDALGVPDWVAQRLWLGSIVLAAAAGVLYLARTLGMRGPGVVVAAVAYAWSPYVLHYAARISVILLPWAALGWMVGLTVKAVRDRGWRHAALFALLVQVAGSVNATALVFAGLAPALWILWATFAARETTWRQALAAAARIGSLTIAASAWWIVGLSIQGGYGINVLRYTETVRVGRARRRTSIPGLASPRWGARCGRPL
jgi:arabinofuranan 3-O-arabinosyltransferase